MNKQKPNQTIELSEQTLQEFYNLFSLLNNNVFNFAMEIQKLNKSKVRMSYIG